MKRFGSIIFAVFFLFIMVVCKEAACAASLPNGTKANAIDEGENTLLKDTEVKVGESVSLEFTPEEKKILNDTDEYTECTIDAWASGDKCLEIKSGQLIAKTMPKQSGRVKIKVTYHYSKGKSKAYYQSTAYVNVLPMDEPDKVVVEGRMMCTNTTELLTCDLPNRTMKYFDLDGNICSETVTPYVTTWVCSSSQKATMVTNQDGSCNITINDFGGNLTVRVKYEYRFTDLATTEGYRLDQGSSVATIDIKHYKVDGSNIYVDANIANRIPSETVSFLNSSLQYATLNATDENPYRVILPAATYKVSETVKIFSNTILDMTSGAVLEFGGVGGANASYPILRTGINGSFDGEADYNRSAKCAGYNGFRNIQVLGGTIKNTNYCKSTNIRIAHAKNVLFDGVTITGGAGMHMMEVAAVDGFVVRNCVFNDFTGSKTISGNASTGRVAFSKIYGNYEALQIDVPASAELYGEIYADGTPMKNVEISGCVFDGVPRGIGTHAMLLGAYHDGIIIKNNTFTNTSKEAIISLGYKNCIIKNNTISGCGAGIVFQGFSTNTRYMLSKVFDETVDYKGKNVHDVNTVISGNKISVVYRGAAEETVAIKLYGANIPNAYTSRNPSNGKVWGNIKAGNYYISNVTVTNNTIVTGGYGIHLSDAKKCIVNNNKITGSNFKIVKAYDGIYLSETANSTNLIGNKIYSMNGNGIHISVSSSIKGEMSGNIVSNVSQSALRIDGIKNNLLVKDNTFKNKSSNNSIVLLQTGATSKYRITLTGNLVKGTTGKVKGIDIQSGRYTISDNIISTGKIGLYIVASGQGPGYGSLDKAVNQTKACYIYPNTYKSTLKKQIKIDSFGYDEEKNETIVKKPKYYANSKVSVKNVSSGSGTIKIDYKKSKDANGYEIEYSTKSSFAKNNTTVYASSKTLSKTLTGLTCNKTYYVRVRSYIKKNNNKIYSKYSDTVKIKTKK